ncbi:sugar phosphate isomerase/epimerase family protein [Lacrimispora sp.]|uniref:sugar phosphate isomerase/epimerase family protein n=1 Tax=Lacrimispora sp. TaxID=2719234 RepID=UPI0028AFBA4A|nr:sugar phosphate isomerase/epimerase family protein [Lacrimispora sp.]
MKYSVFTVGLPEMTVEEALKNMKEYGYDGVDFRVTEIKEEFAKEQPSYWRNNYCTVDINTVEEKAGELKGLADQYGLEVNALASYLTCTDDIDKIASVMRAAKKMGAGRIRVNAPKYDSEKGYKKVFEEALCGFQRVEEKAKETGIKAHFEMHHGTITPSASAAYALAKNFDPEYIGVIYDTGNIIYEGLEEYQMALEILGEYLDHVHIKNACWLKKGEKYEADWASFSDGYADFPKFFKALKAVGYDGYVTFEDFSGKESSDEKLKNNLIFIKEIIGR